jgi:GntR family histidine utilization transcriptional repressor
MIQPPEKDLVQGSAIRNGSDPSGNGGRIRGTCLDIWPVLGSLQIETAIVPVSSVKAAVAVYPGALAPPSEAFTTLDRAGSCEHDASMVTTVAPYDKIKQYLKRELARGRWQPGARMPSESELVERFDVSRMTVNRALRELQTEGLIERVRGLGTFAAQLRRVSSMLTIRDLHEEIVERGHGHRAQVRFAREERASAQVASAFGVRIGTRLFHSFLVHHENERPLQCEDRYVNPRCAPDYLKIDLTKTTPTHYLREVAPHWEAQYAIRATAPTAQEAELLKIKRSEPCLVVTRWTANRGVPITIARLVHPGSRYEIAGRFKP